MSRHRRLDKLVERIDTSNGGTGTPAAFPVDADDDQWLAAFEAINTAGHFAREPEFPVALAE